MTAQQQARLTENIKRDGQLTSLPLVWLMQAEDGTPTEDPAVYEILSNNHRVKSAREAGLTEIDVIVITNWIDRERRIELQLAHNAVGGQDDVAILEQLYESLTLAGKEYSGLTDEVFRDLKGLSLAGFNVDGPDYQEINLTFLPEDAAQFEELVKRAAKAKDRLHSVAHIDTFDQMFDAIVRTKEQMNIQNNAVAIGVLAQLAMERMDQIAESEDDVIATSDSVDRDTREVA